MIRLSFRITLDSDYHLGAGHGVGRAIDSAIHRDADGLPVLRGTTVTGLLREALRFLAEETALGNSVAWQKHCQDQPPVSSLGRRRLAGDLLFGSPTIPKRWRISSARPLGLESPQKAGRAWKAGGLGAHGAAHVRVDPATRRAEDAKLFIREEGDRRWEFRFTATTEERTDSSISEALLLVAAARSVQALGAGRRRGRGACAIHLEAIDGWPTPVQEADLLTAFETYWLNGTPLPSMRINNPSPQVAPEPAAEAAPLRLLLITRADEPLLIARRAEAGNQFEGLTYIPGFALRGAFAARIRANGGLGDPGSSRFTAFVHAFYRDGVLFEHLYPGCDLVTHLAPTYPAPADLFVNEQHPRGEQLFGDDYSYFDATRAAEIDFREPAGTETLRLEPLSDFIAVHRDGLLQRPTQSSEMHVTIDERTGRAQDQALFGYVVIDAGQYFMGEILTDTATWATLAKLADLPDVPEELPSAPFELGIGKARRRGYGKLTAVLLRRQATGASLIAHLPLADRVISPDAPLTLTLLSDALIVDDWGRGVQGFAPEWLNTLFQAEVQIVTLQSASGAQHRLRFATPRTIDSFYNHLGLPRSRDGAIAAGSAVTLRFTTPPDLPTLLDRLTVLERDGIGIRRGEGFGRVIFNLPLYGGPNVELSESMVLLPEALQPGHQVDDSAFVREASFQSRWERKLETVVWSKFNRRAEFADVARAFQAGSFPNTAEGAKQLLNAYGKPGNILPANWSQREKPNRITDNARNELQILKQLVDEMARLAGDVPQLWALGYTMLADRLARAVEAEEQSSNDV